MTSRTPASPRPRRARLLRACVAALAVLLLCAVAVPAFAVTPYDPLHVISDENFRDVGSMSQAEVQAFLETLPGILKTYKAPEWGPNELGSTVVKPASQIIWEASQYWNVNPKLVLATLQKEQSLLTLTAPSSTRLSRAMGAGVYDNDNDGVVENLHPGFGDQIWTGAQKLGATTGAYAWYPGKPKRVYSYPDKHNIYIVPKNQITWNLYTYTPYYPQKGIWDIYVRYFGDPVSPPRFKPVYQFKRRSSGDYFYTSSGVQRYKMIAKDSKTWSYGGVAFSVDASGATNTVPLYRLKNKLTGRYILTAWASERDSLLRQRYRRRAVWSLQAVVAYVALDPANGTPVYRMYNTTRRTYYYTTSYDKVRSLVASRTGWRNQGVAFYLGAYVAPPADPPATPPAG